MKSSIFFVSLLTFGLIGVRPAAAQDYQQQRQEILQKQDSTRSQIAQINALIEQYERRLNETKQRFNEVYKQYENLKRLLALQEQKIASLQKEQRQINAEIAVTERKINQQEKKLKELIANYKETMRYLYKHGRTSQLALILSSASINQMMVRNYYLKEFENYRENQAAEIRETQNQLKESRQQLDEAAQRNEKVLAEIEVEKETLEEKTEEQRVNVNLLSRDRVQLQNKIEKERQHKQNLETVFAQLETREEEVRKAEQERQARLEREEQENENPTVTEETAEPDAPTAAAATENTEFAGEVGFINDEELAEIESAFSSQKGSLPWPVESTTISEHFGRKRHPVYGTVTPNLGIEIVTGSQDPVKVVHGGYVFAVQPIAGYGDVVFVSHGKYKTAYGNLSSVKVRKNTILKKGDVIGYSGDQNSTRGESVFFMLRAGSQNLNPENWLK